VTKPLDSPRIPLYISITGKLCRRGIIVLPSKGTAFRAQTKNDKEEENITYREDLDTQRIMAAS